MRTLAKWECSKLKLISWDINQKFKSEVRESPQRSIVTHRFLNWIVPTIQRNYWNSEWLKIEFKWDQLSDSTWVWFRTWAEIQIKAGNSWAFEFWETTNYRKFSWSVILLTVYSIKRNYDYWPTLKRDSERRFFH